MTPSKGSAARLGLAVCHACGLLARPEDSADQCPRCGAALHLRKPDSLNRVISLTLAAIILYIPANIYPVMTVTMLGSGEPDTILSGVEALWHGGMYPLALLVFFASIAVPMLKLIGLSALVASVKLRSRWRPQDRTRFYRVVEAVGRWSMIDIFVLSLLVALVKLGSIATIEPGIGATCFAGVVVITIFAAASFDSRLIWDAMEEPS